MNAEQLAECLRELGGVLVRWNDTPGRETWAVPDGCASMDATSVDAIARSGLGRFVAWRVPRGQEAMRGTRGQTFEALPAVFRYARGVALREWRVFVNTRTRRSLNPFRWVFPGNVWEFRGNVFAVDASEAKAFATLAGLVFVPEAYLRAEPVEVTAFRDPIRPRWRQGAARPATDAERLRNEPPPGDD